MGTAERSIRNEIFETGDALFRKTHIIKESIYLSFKNH